MLGASKYSTTVAIAIMYWAARITEELEQKNSRYISSTCMYTAEFSNKSFLRSFLR